jgi:hypothetical protein
MRLLVTSFAAVAAIATVAVAYAQTQKGDLWDITSQMEMPGMPMAMPASTQRVCAGKEQPPFQARENCQMTEQQKLTNGWRWKMTCNDGSTADGNMTYQGMEAWNGMMNMKMKEGAMTMKLAGKRVGECDYKPPASTGPAKK